MRPIILELRDFFTFNEGSRNQKWGTLRLEQSYGYSHNDAVFVLLTIRSKMLPKMPHLYRTSFWLNGLFLLVLLVLVVSVKLAGLSAKALFLHPEIYQHFTIGSLTHLLQMLSGVPPIICWFTYGLLQSKSAGKGDRFILASALVTSGFWLNEIYRIHIYLSMLGIGKSIVILVYAITLAVYILCFRKQLASTPYPVLLIGVGVLFVGIFIDALQLPDRNLTDCLEGVPKVLSQLNIAYYFWCVCRQAVLRS